MTNRREFLQIGAAAAVIPAVPAMAADQRRLAFYKMIYDERFAASRAFGRHALALGASVHAIAGDVTDLWYNDLYHRWRETKEPIAGVTSEMSLFCLESLARDAGMRLVYLSDHTRDERDGVLTAKTLLTMSPRETAVRPPVTHPALDGDVLVSWVIAPVARG